MFTFLSTKYPFSRRKSRTTRTPKSDQGVQTEIISKDKGIQTDRNANLPSSGSEEFGYASIERSSMVNEERQVSGSNQALASEPNITAEDEAIEPYAEFGRSGPVFSTLPGYKNAKNAKDGSKGGDRPLAPAIEHGAQTSGHRDVYTLPTRTRRGSENIEVLENTAYDMDG